MATMEDLSRQRLDFEEGPNGETVAILTITLGDGTVHRYRESTDQEELDQLGAAFATAEARQMKIEGLSDDEIAGFFGSIAKGFKSVVNVAKKVASSKVFKAAGRGLAMAAPALGPFAPAAMAVSGGMEMAGRLARSAVAAEAGAKRVARKLARVAKKKNRRKVRKSKSAKKLARYGNKKRKSAFARIARLAKAMKKKKKRSKKKRGKKRSKARRVKRPNIVTAAKKGKLRSNKKGNVSVTQLKSAAKKGRVYWLAA